MRLTSSLTILLLLASCGEQQSTLPDFDDGDVSAIGFLLSTGESLDSLGPNYDLKGASFHGHWQLCQFLIREWR